MAEFLEPASHRPALFDLAYRITGDVAAAEDIAQETLSRALTNPPTDTERPWRPWLIRVAANLAKDQLRSRRRQAYIGPWLPTPLPTPDPEVHSSQQQAVGWAMLIALETLTPQQRSVLVLREVLELNASEVADALHTTPAAVRTAHRRARRALPDFVDAPPPLDAKLLQAALALSTALHQGDLQAVIDALSPDVTFISDGGGQGRYAAATRPVLGASNVARLLLGIQRKGGPVQPELVRLNGVLAFRMRRPEAQGSYAADSLMFVSLAPTGRVATVHVLIDDPQAPRTPQRTP